MAPNPDRSRPPATTFLSLTDVAAICDVTRDVAKTWDRTGQLPVGVAIGVKTTAARGWPADAFYSEWCRPRGMSRKAFDAALAALRSS